MLTIGGAAVGGFGVLSTIWPEGNEVSADVRTPAAAHHHGATAGDIVDPGIPAFAVRMPVPRTLRPVLSNPIFDYYEVAITPANVEILSGVRTAALTYGGTFVGPTIRARSGKRVLVKYRNQIGHQANVHLHGGHVPASSDGHPLDLIDPGAARYYDYPNRQPGTTLWYHDHTHHMEAEHVYRGLHGFYIIDDDEERHLKLPTGEFDVPLMIKDVAFDAAGQLVFSTQDDPYSTRLTQLANGRPQPYFPVADRKYRFRLLNASNHRTMNFSLGGVEMVQIGSDGGLLPRPVSRTEIRLSPAERADVVIDFGRHRLGTKLVLESELGPVVRFDVTRRAPRDNNQVPDVLRPLPFMPTPTRVREVSLGLSPDGQWFWMDGKPFDPNRVDNTIKRGATEIWKVTNADGDFGIEHNFHLHLVRFRVLDRDGAPPWDGESGLKDTVVLPAGSSVRLQATFGDYVGRYTYHCHLMEHASAFQMMAQMEIVR